MLLNARPPPAPRTAACQVCCLANAGCVNCVYNLYADDVEDWKEDIAKARAKLESASPPITKDEWDTAKFGRLPAQAAEPDKEAAVEVWIAQSLPKGDKLETVIQKCTELGADRFIPFASERTVVQYDDKKEGKRLERWRKIAKEAAEQAHRNRVPVIEQPLSWKQLLKLISEADLALICYEILFSGDLGDTAGAQFLFNITNDAWFDGSIGPAQHAHHARVRAVEEGMSLIRAANSMIGESLIKQPFFIIMKSKKTLPNNPKNGWKNRGNSTNR